MVVTYRDGVPVTTSAIRDRDGYEMVVVSLRSLFV
jgi:hypothetical protein